MYLISYILFIATQTEDFYHTKVVRPPHIIKAVVKEQVTQAGKKNKTEIEHTLGKNLLFTNQELFLSK